MPKKSLPGVEELAAPNMEPIQVNKDGVSFQAKPYLPIAQKILLAELIAEGSVEAGIVNETVKEMLLGYYLTKYYTNLDIGDNHQDIPSIYDIIKASGLYQATMHSIPLHEWDDLNKVIDNRLNIKLVQYQEQNTFSSRMVKLLDIFTEEFAAALKNLGPEQAGLLKTLFPTPSVNTGDSAAAERIAPL